MTTTTSNHGRHVSLWSLSEAGVDLDRACPWPSCAQPMC